MRKEIITFKEPKSPISEVFRTLRTNVQFMNTKKGLRSILITSTSPSEGKSWVSANLAVTFAQAGKKVVLVDADMRKGRQFNIFGIAPTPGLSNYLSGISSSGGESSSNILTYVKETEVENLYLVPAGNVPPNPSELLVSDQMLMALEALEKICDLVIFDGTPSDLVTDAVILSRYVDTTIIVTAYKQTKTDGLAKIKKDIENVGGKIAGVVINKMPITQKEYYTTYYYGSSDSKNGKKKKRSKQDEKFEAERKRTESKVKAREVLKQNKEDNKPIGENNTVEEKDSKLFNEEPKTLTQHNFEDITSSSLKATDELLKQMNDYVTEEKEKLEKED